MGLRVGFSVAGSSLCLGNDGESISFDSEGFFLADKKRITGTPHFYKAEIVAVVLNLDSSSPNNNTIALYCGGKKMCDPKPLPDCLIGKPLYPHICYRNMSISVNFGPVPTKELPFKCRMLQAAAQADVVVTPSRAPKDGKYEVVLPVACPDEGTFDWLDTFLEKNPN